MKTLIPFLFLALFLQACLPDEDECRYKELSQELPPTGRWSVDSFHVFVHDTTTGYHFDTVYVNDGTFEFVTTRDSNCYTYGKLLFERANGNQEVLRYGLSTYGYQDFGIRGPALDGYTTNFSETMERTYIHNTLRIFTSGRTRSYTHYSHPKMVRYWEFKLTKLP